MAERSRTPAPLSIPYPSTPFMKALTKLPIVLFRLGLGPLIGRFCVLLTTTGRASGLPRTTAVRFYEHESHIYVISGWGNRAQWMRNLEADPNLTIQTWRGAASVAARRVSGDDELGVVFDWMSATPVMARWMDALDIPFTREAFLAARDKITLITFDPTDQPTPPPVPVDLTWVWSVLGTLIGWLSRRGRASARSKRSREHAWRQIPDRPAGAGLHPGLHRRDRAAGSNPGSPGGLRTLAHVLIGIWAVILIGVGIGLGYSLYAALAYRRMMRPVAEMVNVMQSRG